ncbi:MAG: hypothetical protein ACO1NQ_01270 [Flavobacteriales bacterium]
MFIPTGYLSADRGRKRLRVLLVVSVVSLGLAQAQVPMSFDSIAGSPWNSVTIGMASSLFPETPKVTEGPAGKAYLLGGGCVPLRGFSYVYFERVGVSFIFDPPDTVGVQELMAVVVLRGGAVVTPSGIDVGDEIVPQPNTDGTSFKVVSRYGEDFLEVFDKGVFYYCLPASLKRASKGKSVKVKQIGVRQGRS